MPAKSKAQQRFFGMVRAAQKGEGASSPEVAKVADEISDKDAKKFAKTKHKGLPEKKEVKEEKKGRHPRDQKELDRAVAYIKKNPNFGKKKVDESTKHVVDGEKYLKLPKKYKKLAKDKSDFRSALGKAKDAVTDKLGKTNTDRDGVKDSSNRVFTMQNSYEPEGKLAEGDVPRGPGGNPIRIKDKIKAAKGFIPHKGKPTVEMKESVLDLVRKYGKKKKEKQAQKAQDAGARARRALQRKEYASKVSGSTDNVPDNLRDSLQILKRLIK